MVCGCALILPKPTPDGSNVAESRDQERCRIGITDARFTTASRVDAVGVPVTAVIQLADGKSPDRKIRNGSHVILRAVSVTDQSRAIPGAPTVALTLTSIGGAGGDPVDIHSDSVIRLQPSAAAKPASGGRATASPIATPTDDFAIYKADFADPNRPTTCDSILRDGDFVYLRTAVNSAWVEVRDGVLTGTSPGTASAQTCTALARSCYTDRYGGLLCATIPSCVSAPGG